MSSNGRAQTGSAIQVVDLQVRYGDVIACDKVDFTTYPGERVAIIGPNGAGKSSLFKAIVGLAPIHHGRIIVGGNGHSRVSYVPQHEAVDWSFPANVWDVVMMARQRHIGYSLWPRRRDREAIRKALEQVEMWHLRQRQIGDLSGGQRRRVFIARALAQGARVLLMDEPFAGVDATTEADILAVLDGLRQHDVAILVATHNLGQAATHYDRVLMLNLHQIAYGPPDEIYTLDNLAATFGGFVQMWEQGGQHFVVSDTPCHHADCE